MDSESAGTGTVVVAVLCKHQPESGLKKMQFLLNTYAVDGDAVTLGAPLPSDSLPTQPVVPCPTVNIRLDPPLAHCSALPIPATRINLVPLAISTVQLRCVVP